MKKLSAALARRRARKELPKAIRKWLRAEIDLDAQRHRYWLPTRRTDRLAAEVAVAKVRVRELVGQL